MGAIIRVIITLLSGVGAGKLADKFFPDANLNVVKDVVEDSEGKFNVQKILKWLALTIAGAIAVNFVLKKTGLRKYKLWAIAVYLIGSALMVHSMVFGSPENLVYGILIFTAPGGVGATFAFNMNYLPERITWNDGGNALNLLRIETQEDGVLHDWTAAAIAAMNGSLNVGALATNVRSMYLADGHIKNKNVTVTGQTSQTGAINIFVSSDNIGTSPFKTSLANVLANNDTEFSKFSLLFLPNVVTANDRVQVFYKDGHTQIFDAVELAAWSVLFQQTPSIMVNNLAGYIDKVHVTSAAGGLAYQLSVAL